MPQILKNKNLELHIDVPFEYYNYSRFDWTGKIRIVKFQDITLSSIERTDNRNPKTIGKGFYNEFGIDTALGFEEAKIGSWFHKIGIGLLKKTDSTYSFMKKYEIQPAQFTLKKALNKLVITCQSKLVNGFAYILTKTIELLENGFNILYLLENTGEKAIITDEYVHNFMAVQQDDIGKDYVLKFPFDLKPALFEETVNPEQKVIVGQKEIQFNQTPMKDFFFSNLSGNEKVTAQWQLLHLKHKIALSERLNFPTDKINLWGWKHVISPELFYKINIQPSQSKQWTRYYEINRL